MNHIHHFIELQITFLSDLIPIFLKFSSYCVYQKYDLLKTDSTLLFCGAIFRFRR